MINERIIPIKLGRLHLENVFLCHLLCYVCIFLFFIFSPTHSKAQLPSCTRANTFTYTSIHPLLFSASLAKPEDKWCPGLFLILLAFSLQESPLPVRKFILVSLPVTDASQRKVTAALFTRWPVKRTEEEKKKNRQVYMRVTWLRTSFLSSKGARWILCIQHNLCICVCAARVYASGVTSFNQPLPS